MKQPKYIPEINPAVFWDVPDRKPDFTQDGFNIPRVFNYGNFQEIADVIVCYGRDHVKEILLNSTELNIFGLSNVSAFLGITETQFTSYERIQHRFFKSDNEIRKALENLHMRFSGKNIQP